MFLTAPKIALIFADGDFFFFQVLPVKLDVLSAFNTMVMTLILRTNNLTVSPASLHPNPLFETGGSGLWELFVRWT